MPQALGDCHLVTTASPTCEAAGEQKKLVPNYRSFLSERTSEPF